MAPAVRRKKRKDEIKVVIGPFRGIEDYKTCEEVQREVWHQQDIDIVPTSMLMTAARAGGIVLGAYNSLGDMVGFVFSILGTANGKPIQHSHLLGVRNAYRNFDVAFKLKIAQRREAQKQGISVIRWAFDPMQPVHAYFSLGKLGAQAAVYEANLYGETTSLLDKGLPSDRLLAEWDLDSADVVRRLETGPPRRDYRKEVRPRTIINQLVEVSPGMTTCSPIKLNCTAPQFLFEVPYNLQEIKKRDLGVALEWQGKMRQAFQHYLKRAYAVSDFWVVEQDGHLRAFYFLEKKK